jgi:protein TonB
MSDGASQERSVSDSVGHVSLRLGHLHPTDVLFSFEDQRSRLSRAMGFSVAFHVAGFASFLFLAAWLPTIGGPIDLRNADRMNTNQIVWVAEPGPGGGGGGGGNQSIAPPRLAELPGKETLTVPVLKPPDVTPTPDPEDALPKQEFNIPALTMASAETTLSGVLDTMRSSNSPTALGSGSGGGAGTGTGTGIGPGTGSGLGPGWGGGTGGGAEREPVAVRSLDEKQSAGGAFEAGLEVG